MSVMRPHLQKTPLALAEERAAREAWRHIPPTTPPQRPKYWFSDACFSAFEWVWWHFIERPMNFVLGDPAPPGVDMRANDPLWVLYDPRTGEITSHPSSHRGTDSDGSGMM